MPALLASSSDLLLKGLERINGWIKAHYLGTLLGVVAFGLASPSTGLWLKSWKLFPIPFTSWNYDYPTLALTLLMVSASTHCDLKDLKQLASRRRAWSLSALILYAVVPLMAVSSSFLVMWLFKGEASIELRLGLMFLSLMPVAMTSAVWVRVNMGNVPLLLALITVTTALSVVSVPLYVRFFPGLGDAHLNVPINEIVKQLVISVTLPMLAGIALRQRVPAFVDRWQAAFSFLGTVGLVTALVTNVSSARPHLFAHGTLILTALVVTVALNALYFAVGIASARLLNFSQEDAVTLIFCSGMRNMGTAMVTGMTSFPMMPLVTIPAAIYSISQQILGGYLTQLIQESSGGLLGPSIGQDEAALQSRLETGAARSDRREPGLALLVFRICGGELDERKQALGQVVPRIRQLIRAGDDICFLRPDRFALLLRHVHEPGTEVVAEKVLAVAMPLVPRVTFAWTKVYARSTLAADWLLDAIQNPVAPLALVIEREPPRDRQNQI